MAAHGVYLMPVDSHEKFAVGVIVAPETPVGTVAVIVSDVDEPTAETVNVPLTPAIVYCAPSIAAVNPVPVTVALDAVVDTV